MEQFQFIWRYIKRHKWQYIGGMITLLVVDFANLHKISVKSTFII